MPKRYNPNRAYEIAQKRIARQQPQAFHGVIEEDGTKVCEIAAQRDGRPVAGREIQGQQPMSRRRREHEAYLERKRLRGETVSKARHKPKRDQGPQVGLLVREVQDYHAK